MTIDEDKERTRCGAIAIGFSKAWELDGDTKFWSELREMLLSERAAARAELQGLLHAAECRPATCPPSELDTRWQSFVLDFNRERSRRIRAEDDLKRVTEERDAWVRDCARVCNQRDEQYYELATLRQQHEALRAASAHYHEVCGRVAADQDIGEEEAAREALGCALAATQPPTASQTPAVPTTLIADTIAVLSDMAGYRRAVAQGNAQRYGKQFATYDLEQADRASELARKWTERGEM